MKSWIIIGILTTLMSGAVYFYYSSTQNRIAQLIKSNVVLEENNKQLVAANNQNLKTIDDLHASYVVVQEQFNQIQSEFQVIRSQNLELRERLGRHDIGALAASKPALVENIINNASNDAIRCMELLSGSPLTEKEKGAKTSIQANSECPWLFDDVKQ